MFRATWCWQTLGCAKKVSSLRAPPQLSVGLQKWVKNTRTNGKRTCDDLSAIQHTTAYHTRLGSFFHIKRWQLNNDINISHSFFYWLRIVASQLETNCCCCWFTIWFSVDSIWPQRSFVRKPMTGQWTGGVWEPWPMRWSTAWYGTVCVADWYRLPFGTHLHLKLDNTIYLVC